MKTRTAAEVARLTSAQLVGEPDVLVGPDVTIDSREVQPGSLFVALPGERVHGADYIAAAAAAGATAALTTRPVDAALSQLVVEDVTVALAELARNLVAEARRDGLITLALTGSTGKTSTKDLLAQILADEGPTIAPPNSYNNEIGVPLTACQIEEGTRYLVSEMGTRGAGHIRWLCQIVPPHIAAVLGVGTAHLGELGSVEAIAEAKAEILAGLGPEDWAVLNADDHLVAAMGENLPAKIAWFSGAGLLRLGDLAVRAEDLQPTPLQQYAFDLVVTRDNTESRYRVQLRQLGAHHVQNACAAAAMALAAGLDAGEIARSLGAATERSHWRMHPHLLANGAALINDAYNANPDSMAAALHALAEIGKGRRVETPSARTIAVLGDMAELGEQAGALHAQIGDLAGRLGVDEVIAVGEHAADLVRAARRAGIVARCEEVATVAESVLLRPGDVVLVKASRVFAFEDVAQQLIERSGGEVTA